jgi:hypothetical protein
LILFFFACQLPEMSEEWQLNRLRLLAIAAEPAEPAPGQTVSFTSLAYVPDESDWFAIWTACLDGSDCTLDPALLERFEDFESLSPEEQETLVAELQAAGFIGIEPGIAPEWPVPEDALDGLEEAEREAGLTATIQVSLSTETDNEIVLRSIPVSEATTPNSNPLIGSLSLDGEPPVEEVPGGIPVELVATAALEEYSYLNSAGVVEDRTESLEWRWYAEGGTLSWDDFGEDTDSSTVIWTPPESAGSYLVAVVALDNRGGMGWWSLEVEVP